jgi:drug/metabolite transporter (DMT)-like permease
VFGHEAYGIGGDSPRHVTVGENVLMSRSFGRLTLLSLAAVWVIWGSTYLAIKIGLETLPPFFMQGCRFVVAAVAMAVFLRVRGHAWPTRRQMRNASMVGVMLLIGGLGMVTLAEDRGVDSGLVATIIAIQPMMMAMWGGLWKVWPNRMQWVGMFIGMGGVAILVADDGLSGSWSGVSLVFVACVSWSFGSALSRRIDMPDGPMTTTFEMAAAAVAFMFLSLVSGESVEAPSLRSGLAVAYLVVFGSIVAFSAFTHLISSVSGPLAMSYAYVNPAIAVLLGVVFSDESVSVNMAMALPVILVGVAIVTNASRPSAETEREEASTLTA